MIIYFSGTGNSRYAAALLADKLGDDLVDAGSYIKQGKKGEFTSEKPWIFVAPIYAWDLPRIFSSFLRGSLFSGSRQVYFVLTCGSEIGDPEKTLKELCRLKGLDYQGVLEVVMPENYIAMFSAPTPEEAAPIIRAAHPVLEAGAKVIAAGQPFPRREVSKLNAFKSRVVPGVFYPLFVKAKAFRTTEACNGCGLCVKLCPLNNIDLEDGLPLWGDHCTHCMACICRCPKEAIEYGRISKGKPRYQCPEYKG